MKIQVSIQPELNKVIIYFKRIKPNPKNAKAGVTAHWNAKGKLSYIEIYPAREVLGVKDLSKLELGQLVGVAEAAKIIGVKKPNFIRDFVSKNWFPKPIAELASGRIWNREEIVMFLKKSKQRSR